MGPTCDFMASSLGTENFTFTIPLIIKGFVNQLHTMLLTELGIWKQGAVSVLVLKKH
jgi:hypothetical protein